jgi:uncharacterized membrane protein
MTTVRTAGIQGRPPGRAPASVVEALRRLEDDERLDVGARCLAPLAAATVRSPARERALRGTWLGHALHPLLTDFPLGAWASASLLDLVGGRAARKPARRLIGFGLLTAAPTVASGLAEWHATAGHARRVGVAHAGLNVAATALYGWSWLARRRGHHWRGVVLGLGGGLLATAGGYLGGHLTIVRKIGTADEGFGPAPFGEEDAMGHHQHDDRRHDDRRHDDRRHDDRRHDDDRQEPASVPPPAEGGRATGGPADRDQESRAAAEERRDEAAAGAAQQGRGRVQ